MDRLRIRELLLDEREKLLLTIQKQNREEAGGENPAGGDRPAEEDNPDEMDLAYETAEEEVRSSLDQLSEEILERIDKALEHLETGTYGKCQNCGDDIPAERLLALPYAEFCMRCQARAEDRKMWRPVQ